jgi:hypothetical protein
MNILVVGVTFCMSLNLISADTNVDLTQALHHEAETRKNPIITEYTHPIFYTMVKRHSKTASLTMPRTLKVHDAQLTGVSNSGYVVKAVGKIGAWMDVAGDLFICKAILTELSYEEVESVVLVAFARKEKTIDSKIGSIAAATFLATAASVCFKWRSFIFSDADFMARFAVVFLPSIFCSSIAMGIAENYAQKDIDHKAAQHLSSQRIIEGIQAWTCLEETYVDTKANASLSKFFEKLFYPVRAYTDAERIGYLSSALLSLRQ